MQNKRQQQRREQKQQRLKQQKERKSNRPRPKSKNDIKVNVEAMSKKLQETFGRDEVENLAKHSGFMKRKRLLIPQALILSLICTLGIGKAKWLADILRAYNELTKGKLQYKPFHNQIKKPAFERWVRAILEMALTKLTFQVLEPLPQSKLLRFQDIVIHDGTSFAIKATLKADFPGRFKKVSPAAVELHVTMSGFENTPHSIAITADKESERHFRPDAASIRDCLLLGDRAFQDRSYFTILDNEEASFIIRGTKNIRPIIRKAYDSNNRRMRHLEGKRLSWRVLPRQSVDLTIVWPINATDYEPYYGRLVIIYNPGPRNTKSYTYLHTNLERKEFTSKDVGILYRFRWQIELMFKEWKSHANLHQFDTGKAPIVEGLIWSSMLAAIIKRSITHAAELLRGVALSTLRAARSALNYLTDIIKALFSGSQPDQIIALTNAFDFLEINAKRAHPKRDKLRGRLKPGLQNIAVP